MRNRIPLSKVDVDNISVYSLFSKLGKKVLRPGGKPFSREILSYLDVFEKDVVEFAPGPGATTLLISKLNPKSYIGIDIDKDACNKLSKKYPNYKFINSKAHENNIESESKDFIIVEAMLSLNNNVDKKLIIKEANRILRKGGCFAIHDMFYKNNLSDETIECSRDEVSNIFRQKVYPIKEQEWKELLLENGFEIIAIKDKEREKSMPLKLIKDEGIFRALLIIIKIIFNKQIKKRMKEMKTSITQKNQYLRAFYIVLKKK